MFKYTIIHLFLATFLTSLYAADQLKGSRPNIIVVYADDLGYTDLGCYGANYYKTPHIDALASKGIRFTDAYANSPNCAPSRGALYSGQYCGRTGMYNVGHAERGKGQNRRLIPPPNTGELPLSCKTFADGLSDNGYNCVQFGKWHLGYTPPTLPPKRGFTTRYSSGPYSGKFMSEIIYHPSRWAHFHTGGVPAQDSQKANYGFHIIYGDADDKRNNPHDDYLVKDTSLVKKGEYLSDYIDRKLPHILDDLKTQDKPFLLMLNHYLVHGPVNAPEKDVAPFRSSTPDGDDSNPVFAAMIKKFDDSVGLLMKELTQRQLLKNTLVVVYSDNGGVGGYKELGISGAGEHTGNAPLKGGKTMLYEGGIRVPLIMYWKGKILSGAESSEMVAGIDFFPTMLELAGGSLDEYQQQQKHILDGQSLIPLLNKPQKKLDRDYLAFHFPAYALGYFGKGTAIAKWRSTPMSVLRTRSHKLVEHFVGETVPGDGSRLELYDIQNDPGESKNIAKQKPELAKKLWQDLTLWRESTGALLPITKEKTKESYCKTGNLVVMELTDALKGNFSYTGKGGVLVVESVKKKGKKGALSTSMIIEEINKQPISNINEFKKHIDLHLNKKVTLTIYTHGKSKPRPYLVEAKATEYLPDPQQFNDFQEFVRLSK
ncbi:MAG: sulfatase-like hydrolase/transferase [Planctomycetes bacterium]|nr:sulfatase-like hydrolase/transferase [Planctomycetota bacterium]